MTIRFLIDPQLPPGLAARGYLSEHVNRIGMGTAGDDAIWKHASRIGATLISKDEDFAALAAREPNGL